MFDVSPKSSRSSMRSQKRQKAKTLNQNTKNVKSSLSKFQTHKRASASQYKVKKTPHNDVNNIMKSARSNNSFMTYNKEYSILDGSVMHTSRLDISIDDCGKKNINQYCVQRNLGQGSFGKVKLAKNTWNDQLYAIKIIDQKKIKVKYITRGLGKLAETEDFRKEIAILKKLDHPNIVKLHEVIQDNSKDKVYLVMDWVKKGAVMSKDYWKNELGTRRLKDVDIPQNLSIEKARKYFQGLVSGIYYCNFFYLMKLEHKMKLCHRDVKPDNLLIDSDDRCK